MFRWRRIGFRTDEYDQYVLYGGYVLGLVGEVKYELGMSRVHGVFMLGVILSEKEE